MEPDQTAPDLGPHCLSLRLQMFSGRQKHTFCDYALLGLKKNEFSVYKVRIFMKCTHV